jgi:hypothetical protein
MHIIRRFWRMFRVFGVKGATSWEIGRHGPVEHETGDLSRRGEAEAFPRLSRYRSILPDAADFFQTTYV